ncbi:MAG: hypothetical protein R2881_07555 [Eubacteriales bacterium]
MLVVVSVEFIDLSMLTIRSARSRCGVNGLWGTLAVGLFTVNGASASVNGLFYGGGFSQLGVQALGVAAIAADHDLADGGLLPDQVVCRVSAEEEIQGLDMKEHGLASSYADFAESRYRPSTSAKSTPPGRSSPYRNMLRYP